MGHPPARQLAEHLVGDFDTWIRRQRDDGQSWERIARRLATDHDINVAGETLRRWFPDDTGFADPEGVAS